MKQAMVINIERPFRLCLDVVETDEHVPSMKMKITADVQQFGHRLTYSGCVWFDCTVWDMFVRGFAELDVAEISLVDMGEQFTLKLGTTSGRLELDWEMKKRDASGAVTAATFRSPIDADALAHVEHQFKEFGRWW